MMGICKFWDTISQGTEGAVVTHMAGQVNLRHKRRKEIFTGFEDWEIILFEMASKLRFHRGSQLSMNLQLFLI